MWLFWCGNVWAHFVDCAWGSAALGPGLMRVQVYRVQWLILTTRGRCSPRHLTRSICQATQAYVGRMLVLFFFHFVLQIILNVCAKNKKILQHDLVIFILKLCQTHLLNFHGYESNWRFFFPFPVWCSLSANEPKSIPFSVKYYIHIVRIWQSEAKCFLEALGH